jgi:hypothetical protein
MLLIYLISDPFCSAEGRIKFQVRKTLLQHYQTSLKYFRRQSEFGRKDKNRRRKNP